ncbi:neutral alpha-glucosidase AB [Periplaneta americana]|uniref:neutral alpha-glucosidase AB n=1 Tax=Periplaneta americana TaxID=6978 RepID=UPI0037E700AB
MRWIGFTIWLLSVIDIALIYHADAVDRNNFKSCQQSSFCRRCRGLQPGRSAYELNLNTLKVDPSSIEAELVNTENGVRFHFQLFALKDGTFRMKINEWEPLKPRYEVQYALVDEPSLDKLEIAERTADFVTVKSGSNKVIVHAAPFRVDLYSGDQLVISANARGLMKFEHLRHKPEQNEGGEKAEGEDAPVHDDTETDPGAWEENFKSHHDTKPNGPSAVAMDFSFIGAHYAYGIPEHADAFALKSTKSTDPYRLYNLDVFEYELNNGMALYGSVPVLLAHGTTNTVGIFWMNAAETWVDILGTSDQNVVSSIVNFVSGSAPAPQVDSHFMSESGIIDTFFMLGPKPKDVFRQYIKLTGPAPLPQYFALGHHQCRWNYNDQDDVRNVDNKFDEYDIPNDVMWLDIEHTDNKKYFTWDSIKFSQPMDMVNNLTAKGRKLVTIVDPHIKRDASYFLHNDAENNDYYVKTKDGKVFEGWCWPGSSSYLDLLNPEVRSYLSSRYLLENYQGSTSDLYIWNDMNEPSVFNGPEVTMHKDCVHHGGWEHRDIHNIYGLLHTMATYEGLLQRSGGKLRPFILTRSHYAGSQRFTSVWTGDNTAEWGHLRITIPMCLSLAVAGISFCGADVGGFFRNPDSELFTRWYQAGAFQPFMRTHSHIDTKRREPWLFDEQTLTLIREALRKRYSFLPFWYTLFFEYEQNGSPVMRPLWVEYPSEVATFPLDDEYLLGDKLLVHPVVDKGVSEVSVYFPGPTDIWYDIDNYKKIQGGGAVKIPVTISKIPVFQRGGTIIPKKERIRRSSALTHNDPYTLIVALDKNGSASGTLYMDDGQSFDYRKQKYLYISLEFSANKLSAKFIDNARYPTKSWLERVVILGLPPGVTKAQVESKSQGKVTVETTYNSETQSLVVRKPAVSMAEEWTIVLQ